MDEYLGCRVSLDCGAMGFYQGIISRFSPSILSTASETKEYNSEL